MDKKYITEHVSALAEQIRKITDPTTFILDPRVLELQQQIADLQDLCNHQDDKGSFCINTDGQCQFCRVVLYVR